MQCASFALCLHCASESTLSRPESGTHRGSSPTFAFVAGGAAAALRGRKVGIVQNTFADDVGDTVGKSVSGVTLQYMALGKLAPSAAKAFSQKHCSNIRMIVQLGGSI